MVVYVAVGTALAGPPGRCTVGISSGTTSTCLLRHRDETLRLLSQKQFPHPVPVRCDGGRRAAASAKRIMGRREIAEEAARLDRRIAAYLAGLDESDAGEPDEGPNARAAPIAGPATAPSPAGRGPDGAAAERATFAYTLCLAGKPSR